MQLNRFLLRLIDSIFSLCYVQLVGFFQIFIYRIGFLNCNYHGFLSLIRYTSLSDIHFEWSLFAIDFNQCA